MKKYILLIWLGCSLSASGQSLQEINYNYLYFPDQFFHMELRPVKNESSWTIFYELKIRDTTSSVGEFIIQWEGRESISTKESSNLALTPTEIRKEKYRSTGSVSIPLSESPRILVAKVINNNMKRAWLYYTRLDSGYPVNAILTSGGDSWLKKYIGVSQNASLVGDGNEWIVSYYNDDFPAAPPGFSEKQARVQKAFVADSVYTVSAGSAINFFHKGLYLFQRDTTSANGFAIRAEQDYPRITNAQNLAGPFVYICTRAEFNQLEQAKGNKKQFDRTVLTITGRVDLAKILIKNYYRRVEVANEYFTSYKEGWKTDRGMIYIIFGLPDEVFRFEDREVWTYNTAPRETTFSFIKSPSLFDPDNFVLIRDEKYTQKWYDVVDRWRRAEISTLKN